MSSRPEEEEPNEEIEEGEIVTDDDDVLLTDGEEYEMNEDEDTVDLAGLMTSMLATPDGDTVCSALVNLCYQLETQNKILIKILSRMQPPKSA
jgi:hypothetical protein